MKRILTVTYRGNCPRCGKEQIDSNPIKVDTDCWGCSVNANIERHDIMRDIEKRIKKCDGILIPGLHEALDIIKKYEH